MIEQKTEYQQLPFHRRCVRWWRYMPPCYATFAFRFLVWGLCGFPRLDAGSPSNSFILSRKQTLSVIHGSCVAIAEHRMGNTYSMADLAAGVDDGLSEAEELAQLFHESYEELAPEFGYETRKESRKPWSEVPEVNKQLMVAVCQRVLRTFRIRGLNH